jgi:hypothetical protein
MNQNTDTQNERGEQSVDPRLREAEESASESLREDLEEKEPSEEEKQALREEHEGHLVRDTTSKLTVESPNAVPGMEVEAKAEIPDSYCFDCEEWIGLSGVNLRGTPRSRSEAYYLGGMPIDVLQAKDGTAKTLNELADRLVDRVERLDDRDDAYQFIETETMNQNNSTQNDRGGRSV